MFHDTAATQAAHGKSFKVNGVIESSHASDIVSEEDFAKLKVSDVTFSRTAGGGIAYELEFFVEEPVAEVPTVEDTPAPEPSLDEQLSAGDLSAT